MDHEALLAPISGDSPCGDDLSFSAEFDAIQELRRADDPTLPQGEWVTTLKTADWPGVRRLCVELLTRRGKDLRVAGWLTEACARIDGHAGLADGLALCRALCEGRWDELHPRPDDDGDEAQRAGALRWLLAQVEALAPRLPVLRHGGGSCSLQDIESARTGAGAAGRDAPDADDVAEARRATPPAALAAELHAARRACDALAGLQQAVDARLGADGPSFAGARRALDDAVQAIGRLARDAGVPDGVAAQAGGASDEGGRQAPAPDASGTAAGATGAAHASDAAGAIRAAPAADATAVPGGAPRTREQALRQLREVAGFFRRTEPHSPVAYLAERAARWGEMSLHDWLRTVVKDAGTLSQVEELLGIDPPPGAD